MVAPPDGVHCCSSDSARRYLLTHFDRFQALIIVGIMLQVHTRSTGVVDMPCEVWSS